MTDDELRRAADAAMLPIVTSLAPAGVTGAHWRPDRAGDPVVWIRVQSEAGRVAVESYSWVLPQVQAILSRLVPRGTGVFYGSASGCRRTRSWRCGSR